MSTIGRIGLIFVFIGSIFVALGGWIIWEDHAFSTRSVTVDAQIIEMVRHRDSDGDTMYRPVARFRDGNGYWQEFASKVSSNPPTFEVGERVNVLYDPFDPTDARIDSFSQRHMIPTVFVGFGSLFVFIGGWMAVSNIMRNRAIERLKLRGVKVTGTIVDVFRDGSLVVNGRNPWRMVAEIKDPRTGELRDINSDAIWRRPVGVGPDDTVPVYLSPEEPDLVFLDAANATRSRRDTEHDDRQARDFRGRPRPGRSFGWRVTSATKAD